LGLWSGDRVQTDAEPHGDGCIERLGEGDGVLTDKELLAVVFPWTEWGGVKERREWLKDDE
jgi:hypothetical protein